MLLKVKFLGFFLLLASTAIFAQTNSDWTPIGLTANGRNIQNGVEAYYQLSQCGDMNVVFLKFVNTNSYNIIVDWNDAVFTQQHTWAVNQKGDRRKTLVIGKHKTIFGDCQNAGVQKDLIINVRDFIGDIDQFSSFKLASFNVSSKKSK